jgi:hypothetical protein
LQINFADAELLKNNILKLENNRRDGAPIIAQYIKDLDTNLSKSLTMYLLEYEKAQGVEVKEVIICGDYVSKKIKKVIEEEFYNNLKVDFVNEGNFGSYDAENFTLDELKRYAQCFGLAKRKE